MKSSLLHRALESAHLCTAVRSYREIGGSGSIRVHRVDLGDDTSIIIKSGPADDAVRLLRESEGLEALGSSGHLLVPKVHTLYRDHQCSMLLMDMMQPVVNNSNPELAWQQFGRALAHHHSTHAGPKYGWTQNNFIGLSLQRNTPCESWVEFVARHRLGVQIAMARRNNRISAGELNMLERVVDRLADFIPDTPHPALIHGDLWSGNAICTEHDGQPRVAVIDPAVSVGDGWADIAMMRLFGGFPDSCLHAYAVVVDDHEGIERRVLVYQLYHTLNHYNIFGGSYLSLSMRIANHLLN